MSLEHKSLEELTELKVLLLKRINSNPVHSGIERVELEDVQSWINLKVRAAEHKAVEPMFDRAD